MKTLITNIQVVFKDEIASGIDVILKDGYIFEMRNRQDCIGVDYDEVIDGENGYLVPGYIDIHHHGNSGFDIMDGTIEALTHMGEFQASHGVTSFLGATMTNPKEAIVKALENAKNYIALSNKSSKSSHFLGIYLEGPYFSAEKKGAQPIEFIRNGDMAEINEFMEAANHHIRVVAIAPELDGSLEIIRRLTQDGVKVALGHSNASYAEAEAGILAGGSIATHLYNGMRAFSHREPAIVGAVLTSDQIAAEMIVDMIHLHKAAIQLAYRSKGSEQLILVSDAMRATGLKDGEYDLGGQTVHVTDGKAKLANGTIAGSTLTLDKAVKNMVEVVGVPLVDAIKMASLNPARALGIDQHVGSIEKGKDADLVILNPDLTVKSVLLKGLKI